MKVQVDWQQQYQFTAKVRNHQVSLDAGSSPGSQDTGPSPKELLLMAVCGCIGMDIVAYLKKSKANLESINLQAEAQTTKNHPRVFKEIHVSIVAQGDASHSEALRKAVEASLSMYCGVSAMLSKVSNIFFSITYNEKNLQQGQANFSIPED